MSAEFVPALCECGEAAALVSTDDAGRLLCHVCAYAEDAREAAPAKPRSAIQKALFDDPGKLTTTGPRRPPREEVPGAGGISHRGQSAIVYADRGEGKSGLAFNVGLSAAVAGERVYYFDRENGLEVMESRVKAILDANDWPDVVGDGDGAFVGREYPTLSAEWKPEEFGQAVADEGFTFVVYDNWREGLSQIGGDPNSDPDIQRFVDSFVTPLRRRRIAVLILDNVGLTDKDRPKGSGSKLDAIPQGYLLKTTVPFSPVETGRIELTCTRSRFGDMGRTWTAAIGGGVHEVPTVRGEAPDVQVARKHREAQEGFRKVCVKALREHAPRGRDNLADAARKHGVEASNQKIRDWLKALAADPDSGIISGPDGYSLTPGPDNSGQGGATPPGDPMAQGGGEEPTGFSPWGQVWPRPRGPPPTGCRERQRPRRSRGPDLGLHDGRHPREGRALRRGVGPVTNDNALSPAARAAAKRVLDRAAARLLAERLANEARTKEK